MTIDADPEILGGKPLVKGTRIPVDLVLQLVELGYTPGEIARYYPRLTKDKVLDLLKIVKLVHESVSYEKVKKAVEA